jgi:hypothetical protein
MITNADKGVALGWTASTVCPQPVSGWTNVCTPVTTYGFAATTGATVFSFPLPTAAYPVLQAQDETLYGNDDQGNMIRIMQRPITRTLGALLQNACHGRRFPKMELWPVPDYLAPGVGQSPNQ